LEATLWWSWLKREQQHYNSILQNFANTKMLVATQWRLVMCLFQKATSCGPLAFYKLTTIFVIDRKDDLFFLKGCQMMAIWTK
jgi:hypothetical protein